MVQLERDAKSEKSVLESMSSHLPNYIDELSTMREVNRWLEKVCRACLHYSYHPHDDLIVQRCSSYPGGCGGRRVFADVEDTRCQVPRTCSHCDYRSESNMAPGIRRY